MFVMSIIGEVQALGAPAWLLGLLSLLGIVALGAVAGGKSETDDKDQKDDKEDAGDDKDEDDTGDDADDELPSDPAELKTLLKSAKTELSKVRQESANRRIQLKELKKKAAEKPASEKGGGDNADTENFKQQFTEQKDVADKAQLRARNAAIRSAITTEAVEQRFQKQAIDDAATLILANPDKYGVEVDDEDDSVSGVGEALKEMVKTRPFWIKQADKAAPDLDAQESGKGRLLDSEALLEKKRRDYEPM